MVPTAVSNGINIVTHTRVLWRRQTLLASGRVTNPAGVAT